MEKALIGWLAGVNIANFSLMGVDKSRAKKDAWRVAEKWFFLLALLGGALGGILGMYAFHHKTRHWYFKWGLPLILILQLVLLWFHWEYGIQLL